MVELITFLCTIIGVYIAFLTYKKTFPDQSKEEVEYLVSRYLFARDLNKKMLKTLNNYATDNQSHDQHFMQGITFQKAIFLLDEAQDEIFNLENDELFIVGNLSKSPSRNIKNLQELIDSHIKHLCEVQTYFNFYFEPVDKRILN
jgi:hypothetical protein